jgi:hypothetical protein
LRLEFFFLHSKSSQKQTGLSFEEWPYVVLTQCINLSGRKALVAMRAAPDSAGWQAISLATTVGSVGTAFATAALATNCCRPTALSHSAHATIALSAQHWRNLP